MKLVVADVEDDDEEQDSDRDAVVGHPLVGHPRVPAVAPIHRTTGDQHLGSSLYIAV